MLNSILKFSKSSKQEKLVLLKTCLYFIYFWFILHLFPFKFYRRYFGKPQAETNPAPDYTEENYVKLVQIAVNRVSRFLPFQRKCLTDAIVAKHLLNKQGIKTTLYIGLSKKGTKEILAHAWLRWGTVILTGRKGFENFRVISKYS